MAVHDPVHSPAAAPVLRRFGRFSVVRLLGKSTRSMVWLAADPQRGHEVMLVLPRQAPAPDQIGRWLDNARRGARLRHPNLAVAVEVGEHERWPYLVYDRRLGTTLAERLTSAAPAAEAAGWAVDALDGLAFAHEAGAAHGDLQLHMLLVDASGRVAVMGLEVAPPAKAGGNDAGAARTLSVSTDELAAQRDRAQHDVLAIGVLLHHLLAGRPALDEADAAAVAERLPPQGREIVRLPFSIPHPVAEPLRAIVNRATDRQPRQRYLNARTLARALRGWIEADSQQGGGTHALLLDRVRQIGALPATPGGAARAARLALLEREHTHELAEIVLRDLALSFELLRLVNTALVRGAQVAGNGPVLTVRRAIAMLGLDGVRRAANGLRPWPGPLAEPAARDLAAQIEHSRRAARLAQALRPPGYDAEVVFIVALLQDLGWLLVQYHFAEEAAQIRRLMQPQPAAAAGGRDEPGMSEQQAAYAVLGCDLDGMAGAVARHWGMDDAVLHMMRRLPATAPVRQPDRDDDVLRAVASAAHEAADTLALPARHAAAALERVAQRYHRLLGVTLRDLQAALVATRHDDGGVPEALTVSGHAAALPPAQAEAVP